jgi:hypothetical protein
LPVAEGLEHPPLLNAPLDSIAAATLGKREQQGALLVEMALLQDKERPHKQHGRGRRREGPQRLDRLNMVSP